MYSQFNNLGYKLYWKEWGCVRVLQSIDQKQTYDNYIQSKHNPRLTEHIGIEFYRHLQKKTNRFYNSELQTVTCSCLYIREQKCRETNPETGQTIDLTDNEMSWKCNISPIRHQYSGTPPHQYQYKERFNNKLIRI